ncbi:hypothetical protein CDAR_580101 [Caerostris darwini]|uniref:Uncharacterized protein n=1 Tax=Caerostris darwini TaxID=1538125 RepID=A0AAV4PNM2_9ARAC|nr:hypothetical protein CDAR_580101 [Caerostris darwini]
MDVLPEPPSPPQYPNLDRNVSNGISKEQEEGGGAASGGDDGNWSREKVSETSPSSVPETEFQLRRLQERWMVTSKRYLHEGGKIISRKKMFPASSLQSIKILKWLCLPTQLQHGEGTVRMVQLNTTLLTVINEARPVD